MTTEQQTTEDGLAVIYVTTPDSRTYRYEETAELDAEGRAVFQYTPRDK